MKLLITGSLATFLCFAPAPAPNQAPGSNAADGKSTEITGCLNKSAGKHVITTSDGQKLEVMGPAGQLDAQANKEVKITGEKDSKDGKATFSATKVEMVSAACITKS
jgi:hypothetical protein